jgi:hypothetical protein
MPEILNPNPSQSFHKTMTEALYVCMMYFGIVGVLQALTEYADVVQFREPLERALNEVKAAEPSLNGFIAQDFQHIPAARTKF